MRQIFYEERARLLKDNNLTDSCGAEKRIYNALKCEIDPTRILNNGSKEIDKMMKDFARFWVGALCPTKKVYFNQDLTLKPRFINKKGTTVDEFDELYPTIIKSDEVDFWYTPKPTPPEVISIETLYDGLYSDENEISTKKQNGVNNKKAKTKKPTNKITFKKEAYKIKKLETKNIQLNSEVTKKRGRPKKVNGKQETTTKKVFKKITPYSTKLKNSRKLNRRSIENRKLGENMVINYRKKRNINDEGIHEPPPGDEKIVENSVFNEILKQGGGKEAMMMNDIDDQKNDPFDSKNIILDSYDKKVMQELEETKRKMEERNRIKTELIKEKLRKEKNYTSGKISQMKFTEKVRKQKRIITSKEVKEAKLKQDEIRKAQREQENNYIKKKKNKRSINLNIESHVNRKFKIDKDVFKNANINHLPKTNTMTNYDNIIKNIDMFLKHFIKINNKKSNSINKRKKRDIYDELKHATLLTFEENSTVPANYLKEKVYPDYNITEDQLNNYEFCKKWIPKLEAENVELMNELKKRATEHAKQQSKESLVLSDLSEPIASELKNRSVNQKEYVEVLRHKRNIDYEDFEEKKIENRIIVVNNLYNKVKNNLNKLKRMKRWDETHKVTEEERDGEGNILDEDDKRELRKLNEKLKKSGNDEETFIKEHNLKKNEDGDYELKRRKKREENEDEKSVIPIDVDAYLEEKFPGLDFDQKPKESQTYEDVIKRSKQEKPQTKYKEYEELSKETLKELKRGEKVLKILNGDFSENKNYHEDETHEQLIIRKKRWDETHKVTEEERDGEGNLLDEDDKRELRTLNEKLKKSGNDEETFIKEHNLKKNEDGEYELKKRKKRWDETHKVSEEERDGEGNLLDEDDKKELKELNNKLKKSGNDEETFIREHNLQKNEDGDYELRKKREIKKELSEGDINCINEMNNKIKDDKDEIDDGTNKTYVEWEGATVKMNYENIRWEISEHGIIFHEYDNMKMNHENKTKGERRMQEKAGENMKIQNKENEQKKNINKSRLKRDEKREWSFLKKEEKTSAEKVKQLRRNLEIYDLIEVWKKQLVCLAETESKEERLLKDIDEMKKKRNITDNENDDPYVKMAIEEVKKEKQRLKNKWGKEFQAYKETEDKKIKEINDYYTNRTNSEIDEEIAKNAKRSQEEKDREEEELKRLKEAHEKASAERIKRGEKSPYDIAWAQFQEEERKFQASLVPINFATPLMSVDELMNNFNAEVDIDQLKRNLEIYDLIEKWKQKEKNKGQTAHVKRKKRSNTERNIEKDSDSRAKKRSRRNSVHEWSFLKKKEKTSAEKVKQLRRNLEIYDLIEVWKKQLVCLAETESKEERLLRDIDEMKKERNITDNENDDSYVKMAIEEVKKEKQRLKIKWGKEFQAYKEAADKKIKEINDYYTNRTNSEIDEEIAKNAKRSQEEKDREEEELKRLKEAHEKASAERIKRGEKSPYDIAWAQFQEEERKFQASLVPINFATPLMSVDELMNNFNAEVDIDQLKRNLEIYDLIEKWKQKEKNKGQTAHVKRKKRSNTERNIEKDSDSRAKKRSRRNSVHEWSFLKKEEKTSAEKVKQLRRNLEIYDLIEVWKKQLVCLAETESKEERLLRDIDVMKKERNITDNENDDPYVKMAIEEVKKEKQRLKIKWGKEFQAYKEAEDKKIKEINDYYTNRTNSEIDEEIAKNAKRSQEEKDREEEELKRLKEAHEKASAERIKRGEKSPYDIAWAQFQEEERKFQASLVPINFATPLMSVDELMNNFNADVDIDQLKKNLEIYDLIEKWKQREKKKNELKLRKKRSVSKKNLKIINKRKRRYIYYKDDQIEEMKEHADRLKWQDSIGEDAVAHYNFTCEKDDSPPTSTEIGDWKREHNMKKRDIRRDREEEEKYNKDMAARANRNFFPDLSQSVSQIMDIKRHEEGKRIRDKLMADMKKYTGQASSGAESDVVRDMINRKQYYESIERVKRSIRSNEIKYAENEPNFQLYRIQKKFQRKKREIKDNNHKYRGRNFIKAIGAIKNHFERKVLKKDDFLVEYGGKFRKYNNDSSIYELYGSTNEDTEVTTEKVKNIKYRKYKRVNCKRKHLSSDEDSEEKRNSTEEKSDDSEEEDRRGRKMFRIKCAKAKDYRKRKIFKNKIYKNLRKRRDIDEIPLTTKTLLTTILGNKSYIRDDNQEFFLKRLNAQVDAHIIKYKNVTRTTKKRPTASSEFPLREDYQPLFRHNKPEEIIKQEKEDLQDRRQLFVKALEDAYGATLDIKFPEPDNMTGAMNLFDRYGNVDEETTLETTRATKSMTEKLEKIANLRKYLNDKLQDAIKKFSIKFFVNETHSTDTVATEISTVANKIPTTIPENSILVDKQPGIRNTLMYYSKYYHEKRYEKQTERTYVFGQITEASSTPLTVSGLYQFYRMYDKYNPQQTSAVPFAFTTIDKTDSFTLPTFEPINEIITYHKYYDFLDTNQKTSTTPQEKPKRTFLLDETEITTIPSYIKIKTYTRFARLEDNTDQTAPETETTTLSSETETVAKSGETTESKCEQKIEDSTIKSSVNTKKDTLSSSEELRRFGPVNLDELKNYIDSVTSAREAFNAQNYKYDPENDVYTLIENTDKIPTTIYTTTQKIVQETTQHLVIETSPEPMQEVHVENGIRQQKETNLKLYLKNMLSKYSNEVLKNNKLSSKEYKRNLELKQLIQNILNATEIKETTTRFDLKLQLQLRLQKYSNEILYKIKDKIKHTKYKNMKNLLRIALENHSPNPFETKIAEGGVYVDGNYKDDLSNEPIDKSISVGNDEKEINLKAQLKDILDKYSREFPNEKNFSYVNNNIKIAVRNMLHRSFENCRSDIDDRKVFDNKTYIDSASAYDSEQMTNHNFDKVNNTGTNLRKQLFDLLDTYSREVVHKGLLKTSEEKRININMKQWLKIFVEHHSLAPSLEQYVDSVRKAKKHDNRLRERKNVNINTDLRFKIEKLLKEFEIKRKNNIIRENEAEKEENNYIKDCVEDMLDNNSFEYTNLDEMEGEHKRFRTEEPSPTTGTTTTLSSLEKHEIEQFNERRKTKFEYYDENDEIYKYRNKNDTTIDYYELYKDKVTTPQTTTLSKSQEKRRDRFIEDQIQFEKGLNKRIKQHEEKLKNQTMKYRKRKTTRDPLITDEESNEIIEYVTDEPTKPRMEYEFSDSREFEIPFFNIELTTVSHYYYTPGQGFENRTTFRASDEYNHNRIKFKYHLGNPIFNSTKKHPHIVPLGMLTTQSTTIDYYKFYREKLRKTPTTKSTTTQNKKLVSKYAKEFIERQKLFREFLNKDIDKYAADIKASRRTTKYRTRRTTRDPLITDEESNEIIEYVTDEPTQPRIEYEFSDSRELEVPFFGVTLSTPKGHKYYYTPGEGFENRTTFRASDEWNANRIKLKYNPFEEMRRLNITVFPPDEQTEQETLIVDSTKNNEEELDDKEYNKEKLNLQNEQYNKPNINTENTRPYRETTPTYNLFDDMKQLWNISYVHIRESVIPHVKENIIPKIKTIWSNVINHVDRKAHRLVHDLYGTEHNPNCSLEQNH